MDNWLSYRDALSEFLEKRKAEQGPFSIRALSKELGVTATHFADVLSKKRGLSANLAVKIAEFFSMSNDQRMLFLDLVQMEDARSENDRRLASKRIDRRKGRLKVALPDSEIAFLQSWLNPALLELITVKRGDYAPVEFAKRFGVSLESVRVSYESLMSLGFLEKFGEVHTRVKDYIHQSSDKSNSILRDFHRQIFAAISDRLERVPPLERSNLTSVLTCDSNQIEEARRFLAEKHAEFIEKFMTTSNSDSVYVLNSHFVRLDDNDA